MFLILGVLLIVIGIGAMYTSRNTAKAPTGELVPVEPAPTVDATWKAYTDDSVTFRYPAEFPATYIRPVEWPPGVTVSEGTAECMVGKTEMGETKQASINDHDYCVTTSSEGAAGSVYVDYAYATQKDGKTATLAFTLRMTQCGNYDEPQKTACERERNDFSIDDLADRITQTFEFK